MLFPRARLRKSYLICPLRDMIGVEVLEKTQPEGVFFVGVLTMLSALGLLFVALFIFIFEQTPGSSVTQMLVARDVALYGGWGLLLLADAFLILRGTRIAYFLSLVLWLLTLAADLWWSFSIGLFSQGSIFSIGGLYLAYYALYSILCFAYFSRSSVKTYFGTQPSHKKEQPKF